MKRIPLFTVTGLLLAMAVGSGCRETQFDSAWSERAVTVDGQYSEWTAPLRYFDQPSMYMGFRNDRDNLYILVKTVDRRAQIKVLRLGLTVWFDPPGNSLEKAWGVHYPLGMKNPGVSMVGRDTPPDLNAEQRRQVTDMLGEMEVREAGDGKRVCFSARDADSSGYGIQAAVRDTPEVIVYELKVPLRGGKSPFAVVPDRDGRVRLRFETGDIRPEQWSSVRSDSLRVVDPLGNAGSGNIYNKGRKDRNGRPRLTAPPNPITEPIRFEATVRLAGEPDRTDTVRR